MPLPTLRRRSGFTLLEMMIVVAIIGVLMALAVAGMTYGVRRANLSSAAFDSSALVSLSQMRASSTGMSQYVAVWEGPTEAQVMAFSLPTLATPTWASADWSNPASFGAQRIERVRIPNALPGVAFVPVTSDTSLGAALPAPFQAISLTVTGATTECTFCVALTSGGPGWVGVIRFSPDGSAQVLTGSHPAGGAFALGARQSSTALSTRVIAIAAPAGAVRVY